MCVWEGGGRQDEISMLVHSGVQFIHANYGFLEREKKTTVDGAIPLMSSASSSLPNTWSQHELYSEPGWPNSHDMLQEVKRDLC